jgi:16S rRNA (guanine966-N2)-methyltransferase
MRIIAGSLRGRRLEAPPGAQTRPITDRIKETLFNILGARLGLPGSLPAVAVLDLFAGSGGLGLEALSRGASSCLFVERSPQAVRVLRANIAHLGVAAVCRVSAQNAWTVRLPAVAGGYGLVFIDPPYRAADDLLAVADLLERLSAVVAPEGLVVFRHVAQSRFPSAALRSFRCVDERELGTMRVWLFTPMSGVAGDQA